MPGDLAGIDGAGGSHHREDRYQTREPARSLGSGPGARTHSDAPETLPTCCSLGALMASARFGVFGALAGQPLTTAEVAERCGTHPGATRTLLDTLVSGRTSRSGGGALRPLGRGPANGSHRTARCRCTTACSYRYVERDWIARLDGYLQDRTVPLNIHAEDDLAGQWSLYQRGMLPPSPASRPESWGGVPRCRAVRARYLDHRRLARLLHPWRSAASTRACAPPWLRPAEACRARGATAGNRARDGGSGCA